MCEVGYICSRMMFNSFICLKFSSVVIMVAFSILAALARSASARARSGHLHFIFPASLEISLLMVFTSI